VTGINWLRAGAMSAVFAAAFAQSAGAQVVCTVTLTGQNDPAVDAAAVQSALIGPVGDFTLCLQGTFDFGTPPAPSVNSVTIVASPLATGIHIVGLNDENGKKATIRNGRQAFTKQAAELQALAFSIENLRFEQPEFSAISILGSGAASTIKISGVNIVGVRTFLFATFNNRFREGIVMGTALAPIGGDIEISNNVINGGSYTADDTTLGVSGGIVLTGALPNNVPANRPFTARVRISDNRIVNWSGSGILVAGVEDVTIERNVIQPGAFANTIPPGCTAGNGTGAANGISLQSVTDATVRDNSITLVPALTGANLPPPCTAGLILVGPINVLPGSADGNLVYRNRIRGSGTYAIAVGVTPAAAPPGPIASLETDNLFALNLLGNFVPQVASLFIGPGANGNAFVGSFPSTAGNVDGNDVITRLD
jgi:hypothetical protein